MEQKRFIVLFDKYFGILSKKKNNASISNNFKRIRVERTIEFKKILIP